MMSRQCAARLSGTQDAQCRHMSQPRQIIPGQYYMLTRRCTQRQFLLRPDATTSNIFTYCLAVAAQRYEIDVLLAVAESNHHHTVIFDRHGRCPRFIEHFHKLFARCQNARFGRWENLWSSDEPSVTRLLSRDTVIAKLVYAASNPVKDLLVERATQWPGVNSYRELLSGKPMHAHRPRHFFRPDGAMPKAVTLRLAIPADLGTPAEVRAEVRAGVAAVEHERRAHRAATGARIVGRRQLQKESWRRSPSSREPRRGLRPRFAGPAAERIAALVDYRHFLAAYRVARTEWLGGNRPAFPAGTYWLARCAPIVAPPPS